MGGQGKVEIGWMEQGTEATTYIYIYNLPWCLSSFNTNYIIFRNVEIFEKKTFLSKNKIFVKETRESLVYSRVFDFFGHGIFKIN